MNIANITTVIVSVATQRRPPAMPWTRSNRGQVATTIVAAHINAPRNGSIVHRLAAISTKMISTISVTRARSKGARVIH